MNALDLEMASGAILKQLDLAKSRESIDRYLISEKAEAMASIKEASPDMHAFILLRAQTRKRALAGAK